MPPLMECISHGAVADDERGTRIGLGLGDGLDGLVEVGAHGHLGHVDVAVGHGDLGQVFFLARPCRQRRTAPPGRCGRPWRPGRRCWSTPRCRTPGRSRPRRRPARGPGRRSRCRRPSRRRRRSTRTSWPGTPCCPGCPGSAACSRLGSSLGRRRTGRSRRRQRPWRLVARRHGASQPASGRRPSAGVAAPYSHAAPRHQPTTLVAARPRGRGSMPRPCSALSSNREFAQAGPWPSSFTV